MTVYKSMSYDVILIIWELLSQINPLVPLTGGVSYIEGGGVRGARIQEKGGGVKDTQVLEHVRLI